MTFDYKTKEFSLWETEYLKKDQVTLMHSIKEGYCYQTNVSDKFVEKALKAGESKGTCAGAGYKTQVKKFEWKTPKGYLIPVVQFSKPQMII